MDSLIFETIKSLSDDVSPPIALETPGSNTTGSLFPTSRTSVSGGDTVALRRTAEVGSDKRNKDWQHAVEIAGYLGFVLIGSPFRLLPLVSYPLKQEAHTMDDELEQLAADYLSSVLGFNGERIDPVLGGYHLAMVTACTAQACGALPHRTA